MAELFASSFKRQYPSPRWKVWAPDPWGAHRCAVTEAVSGLQTVAPYLVEAVRSGDPDAPDPEDHVWALGTPDDHPLVREMAARGDLPLSDHPQGYTLHLSPEESGHRRRLVVAARTPAGVLHGVAHVNAEWIGHETLLHPSGPGMDMRRLEALPARTLVSAPRIERRGLWSWGYPVYDYRGFLDNMARLRMNTLILWNDEPPLNWDDVVLYAAGRHIEVIPGFHWGWGTTADLADDSLAERIRAHVFAQLARYPRATTKAVYFQTLTEVPGARFGDQPVADFACGLVNRVARAVRAEYPDLRLYFGVHAISVEDNLAPFETLDPGVSLVWEDAGVIPYMIDPVADFSEAGRGWRPPMDTPAKTTAYSERLARLRGGLEFNLVAKGFPNLSWSAFENHRGFLLGEAPASRLRARAAASDAAWRRVNGLWAKNFPLAADFFAAVLAGRPRSAMATCLVEDALFERRIEDGIALLAAILWDPERPRDDYYRYIGNDYFAQCAW